MSDARQENTELHFHLLFLRLPTTLDGNGIYDDNELASPLIFFGFIGLLHELSSKCPNDG